MGKIQDIGLIPLYKSDENVKKFCGMLDGLALLDYVAAGIWSDRKKIQQMHSWSL